MKKIIRILLLSTVIAGVSNLVCAADAVTVTTTPVAASTTTTAASTTDASTLTPDNVRAFTPDQVTQLQKIIHDYLVANPQVLVEASQTLQAEQEKKMQTAAMTAIAQNKTALFDDTQSPSIGSKEAPVTIVEFFDYQCGHCRAMQPTIEKLVKEDKNIHVIFKELPIFGGVSDFAAKVALAAAKSNQAKYYGLHQALLTSSNPLTQDSILAMVKKSGFDVAIVKKDMASPDIQKQLKANFQLAQNLKIMGTPTFVIGNKAQTKFAYIPGATTLKDLQDQLKSVQ